MMKSLVHSSTTLGIYFSRRHVQYRVLPVYLDQQHQEYGCGIRDELFVPELRLPGVHVQGRSLCGIGSLHQGGFCDRTREPRHVGYDPDPVDDGFFHTGEREPVIGGTYDHRPLALPNDHGLEVLVQRPALKGALVALKNFTTSDCVGLSSLGSDVSSKFILSNLA